MAWPRMNNGDKGGSEDMKIERSHKERVLEQPSRVNQSVYDVEQQHPNTTVVSLGQFEDTIVMDQLPAADDEGLEDGGPAVTVSNQEHSSQGPWENMVRDDEEAVLHAKTVGGVSHEDPIAACFSCPAQLILEDRFDPIASVECTISPHMNAADTLHENMSGASMFNTHQKRPRGRPKKIVNSLAVPLCVPSTPSTSNLEAFETWKVGKLLGVQSLNEEAAIEELRKSKRIMAMEGSATARA